MVSLSQEQKLPRCIWRHQGGLEDGHKSLRVDYGHVHYREHVRRLPGLNGLRQHCPGLRDSCRRLQSLEYAFVYSYLDLIDAVVHSPLLTIYH